jgi:hypothetical protein
MNSAGAPTLTTRPASPATCASWAPRPHASTA